jgi:mRNA interferase RelE/StbE
VYKIAFTKGAAKSLQKMPRGMAGLIRERLAQLASDPFAPQHNAIKLQGRPGYRLRVGDWRVIYEIRNEELIILILKIAPRGEVYR